MPPKYILDVPTIIVKEMGFGAEYVNDHSEQDGFFNQDSFHNNMTQHQFYISGPRGFEREIAKRLEYWDKLKKAKSKA